MSLSISILKANVKDNGYDEIELPKGRDLAGGERWRTEVYGSELLRGLGLEALPELAAGDISAFGEELLTIKKEANLLLENISEISTSLGIEEEKLRFRIKNISDACDQASARGAELRIW